jgi:hypothetical protein
MGSDFSNADEDEDPRAKLFPPLVEKGATV